MCPCEALREFGQVPARYLFIKHYVLHFPTHPSVYWVVFAAKFENSCLGPLNDRPISVIHKSGGQLFKHNIITRISVGDVSQ